MPHSNKLKFKNLQPKGSLITLSCISTFKQTKAR